MDGKVNGGSTLIYVEIITFQYFIPYLGMVMALSPIDIRYPSDRLSTTITEFSSVSLTQTARVPDSFGYKLMVENSNSAAFLRWFAYG